MTRFHLSCIALVIATAAACSSSSSDPSPSPAADAGADATTGGGDSGVGDAAHPLTACTSRIETDCLLSGAGGGARMGCNITADHCSEGHSYGADCDGDGNCVCSVDGVQTCTCSTGVATCDETGCDCPLVNGFCCFTGVGLTPPPPPDGG